MALFVAGAVQESVGAAGGGLGAGDAVVGGEAAAAGVGFSVAACGVGVVVPVAGSVAVHGSCAPPAGLAVYVARE
ncbi:hypothetical protein [Mycobacteroides stephanolepidis]|uniref:hypothetical protein n=1 Tax=[Mycobacterium] stephanolepidis TaxID=1520670 RepID=UPI0013008A9A|nr:hypothetical protein [[Mycobacterium] stephanolepidis]